MQRRRNSSSRDTKPRRTTGGKRSRHLQGVTDIDFRDASLLRRFVTQQGKIMPARLNSANAKQQRQIARAVRRARVLGIMP